VTFQSTTVSQAQYRYLQTGASGLAAQAVTEGTPNQTAGLTTTGNNYLQLSFYTSATTTSANIYLATIELVNRKTVRACIVPFPRAAVLRCARHFEWCEGEEQLDRHFRRGHTARAIASDIRS
jgi:hypothetical protein